MSEEQKQLIKEEVRMATDSAIQSLTNIVGEIQKSSRKTNEILESHRAEEIASREVYKDKMMEAVADQIKVTVNGKIDKIDTKIDIQSTKFEEHVVKHEYDMVDLKEIIKNHKDSKALKGAVSIIAETVTSTGKRWLLPIFYGVIAVSTFVGALTIIFNLFK